MRVSVDGGIGAGKSSVLASLRERGFLTVPEPVDSWQEMLARMYDDPTRWSASFNINVLLSFAESLDDSRNVCVYERSPLSTMHVFSVLQERLGFMTGHEMQLIRRIFRQVAWIPDVIVYLQTRPEVAYERMQERGRRAESSVPYSYLEELHEEYERFMGSVRSAYPSVRVITVDATKDKDAVLADILSHAAAWDCAPVERK